MRNYATIVPSWWTVGPGKQFRDNPDASALAIYLETAPQANLIGLYYIPLPTMAHAIGRGIEGASKALGCLIDGGFAAYDERSETAWVVGFAERQTGAYLKAGDKRRIAVARELGMYRNTPFYGPFIRKYGAAYSLACSVEPMPQRRGIEGTPMPLPSQDQNQNQDQDHDQLQKPGGSAQKAEQTPPSGSISPPAPVIQLHASQAANPPALVAGVRPDAPAKALASPSGGTVKVLASPSEGPSKGHALSAGNGTVPGTVPGTLLHEEESPFQRFLVDRWPKCKACPDDFDADSARRFEIAEREAHPGLELLAIAKECFAYEHAQPKSERYKNHRRFLHDKFNRARQRADTAAGRIAAPARTARMLDPRPEDYDEFDQPRRS